jgi:ATP-dependent Clp protease protease subunit
MQVHLDVSNSINYRKADLFDQPIVVKVTDFTTTSFESFRTQFSNAASHPDQPIIPIVIDTYGGQVYSLLPMLSLIEDSTKPVATIALGKAMSCGAILLGCGTPGYRFADPNATIMIHDVSSGSRGKVEELKSSVKETERVSKLAYSKLSKACGQQDKNFFFKKIAEKKYADWFLTATQAKKLKLIDHIGIPEMHVSVEVSMEFRS